MYFPNRSKTTFRSLLSKIKKLISKKKSRFFFKYRVGFFFTRRESWGGNARPTPPDQEIAEYKGDDAQKEKELQEYKDKVNNPAYGEMYNAYNAVVYAEEFKDFDKALQIAQRDVNNRSTPETYHNLAYVHHLAGNNEKALALIEDHVKGKTYEPMALYHSAIIYKANGMTEQVETLKNDELLGTAYEMGPVTYEKIKNL